MAIDEGQRLRLAKAAERALVMEEAVALMASLPPTGWGEVATKQDLAVLRAEIGVVRAELHAELASAVARMQRWTVTTGIAVAGAVIAAMRFA